MVRRRMRRLRKQSGDLSQGKHQGPTDCVRIQVRRSDPGETGGGKDRPDVQLFCEQCQYVTHIDCLDLPLETIPEDNWYSPDCFTDSTEIVQAGQKVGYSKKLWKAMPPKPTLKISRQKNR
jgi:hypothetical protein